MQTTHKIAGDAAAGFALYLTSVSSRGDYYAGDRADDGHDDEAGVVGGGVWHGSSRALGRVGLSPGARVERRDLVSLMRGVSPDGGGVLRPVGADGSRVAGIDMTFSAPKTVSALWGVSSLYRRAQIEAAHRGAVASALARVERDVALVRRRGDGVVRWERAGSLVAAEFVHSASRLTRDQERGGVPDPQLHSHVVVVAAERTDGRFAAVDSREVFRSARANGAWYRAELAWRLGELGLEVQGRTGREGRFFEVAGVPADLAERWSARTADIDAAARVFRQRYGREPRAGELGAMTIATRGTKTVAAQVDVDVSWRAVGEAYGLDARSVQRLFVDRARHNEPRPSEELLADVTAERSMVNDRDLRARAFELAAGSQRPAEAWDRVTELARSGELVQLEGGWWTTRALRDLEQRTLNTVAHRAAQDVALVSDRAREAAHAAAGARVGGVLSAEQRRAVEVITGPGGVTGLVGEAGTGKGVVIGAARDTWERDGYRVIGTALAGATAKRLGADAQMRESMTADALLRRQDCGQLRLDRSSVVVMDEAGMVDTRRLAALVDATNRAGAKLVLVGDGAQLAPIGAGGLFDQIAPRVPSARLSEVRRANHEWERDAWRQVRSGNAGRALAGYQAHGRLHVSDTRDQAAEAMVAAWDRARLDHGRGRTVMLTDASNDELDHINAMAQQVRAANGELGSDRATLPDRPYTLAAGDEVVLTGQLRPHGQERVENGTPGEIVRVDGRSGRVVMRTFERPARDVEIDTVEFSDIRLGYAQHVYKAQGLTAERAFLLTGGWQTDRERAYVGLTRARERTDVFVSREDLGEDGLDAGAIERLGERMSVSRAQQASVAREEIAPPAASRYEGMDWWREDEVAPEHESEVGRIMREQRERGRDVGFGIE